MSGKRPWYLAAAVALLALSVALAGCGQGAQQGDTGEPELLIMGFVPSQNAQQLVDTAQPLADMLSEKLGIPVRPFVSSNFIGLVEAMGAGRADIGFLNPFGYVLAHDLNDTRVILKSIRFGSSTYRSQIITGADTGIEELGDVAGKSFAFVDPASTSGYLFPAAMLKENGVDPDQDLQHTFAGGHDNAVVAVYSGDADAGAVFEDARTLVEEDYPDVMDKVKVVAYTKPIPNDTVSVAPHVSADLEARIQEALLEIAETDAGQQVLGDIYNIDGFDTAQNSDYDIIREVAEVMEIDLEELATE